MVQRSLDDIAQVSRKPESAALAMAHESQPGVRPVNEDVIKKTNISEKEFGLFQFLPAEPNRMEIAKIETLCRQVTDEIGAVHGIVLPEMATNRDGLDLLIDVAQKEQVEFLIAGVYEPGMAGGPAENFLTIWRAMVLEHDRRMGGPEKSEHAVRRLLPAPYVNPSTIAGF